MVPLFYMPLFCFKLVGVCWLNLVCRFLIIIQLECLHKLKVLKIIISRVLLLMSCHVIFIKTQKAR